MDVRDELRSAYNEAIERGDEVAAKRWGDALLRLIFDQIMQDDEYDARQRGVTK